MTNRQTEPYKLNLLIVIPARGGSRGIVRKNMQKIDGISLIARSISSATLTKIPSVVVVSTDDSEIMEESKAMGALVIERPASLCGDNSLTELAMEHVLTELSNDHSFSHIVLLQPTSPIRRKFLIDEVITKLLTDGTDSIVGVVRRPPFFWKGHLNDATQLYSLPSRPMRQNISAGDWMYQETGNIYISKIENFLSSHCRLSGKISLFILTENEALDIDTSDDLLKAEQILAGLK
jgi:CMP-N,N'-diacetyllegionaminic acid synthase